MHADYIHYIYTLRALSASRMFRSMTTKRVSLMLDQLCNNAARALGHLSDGAAVQQFSLSPDKQKHVDVAWLLACADQTNTGRA